MQRFLARAGTPERHICHRDREWAASMPQTILSGSQPALDLGGEVIAVDMTDPAALDYAKLLAEVREKLTSSKER
jgi:hypothetical protein